MLRALAGSALIPHTGSVTTGCTSLRRLDIAQQYPAGVVLRRGLFRREVHLSGATGDGARLACHAVAKGDDVRGEGSGLDEFEIHSALVLGEEGNATAKQHRVDPRPVLVDQT